jgi:hypothetical protein
VPGDTPMSPV